MLFGRGVRYRKCLVRGIRVYVLVPVVVMSGEKDADVTLPGRQVGPLDDRGGYESCVSHPGTESCPTVLLDIPHS